MNLPLLKIPVDHYAIDELPIFDILMSNIISMALMMDRTARDGSKQYLEGLIPAIRSCGVTFHTWKEQGREQQKWTSLTGDGRKKVMKVIMYISLLQSHSKDNSTDTAI